MPSEVDTDSAVFNLCSTTQLMKQPLSRAIGLLRAVIAGETQENEINPSSLVLPTCVTYGTYHIFFQSAKEIHMASPELRGQESIIFM